MTEVDSVDPGRASVTEQTSWSPSRGYRNYVLSVFVVVYVINFVDRYIFSILIEPIRADIELSDAQLGLLGGIAFALFYTFAGIPIARWADVGVRKNIVSAAILIWSGMTMFTGVVRSFPALLIARIGVGIGEAGCSPPIHSLISDYFPEEKRATALSIYSMGVPIGSAIGTLAGGWIGEYFGWRTAFYVVGLPGVIVAIVFYLTIAEAPRGYAAPVPAQNDAVSLKGTLRYMWGLNSFRHLSLAGAYHAFAGYGVALFLPSFFMRVHGFGLAETSNYLFAIGLTGMIGTFLGGYLGDRYGGHDKRWYVGVPGLATLLSIPFSLMLFTTGDPTLAIVLAVPPTILGPMYMGPTFGLTQMLATPAMRATASAILLFILNLIGLGLGPVFAGLLSDSLRSDFGEEAIRYALLILAAGGNACSALHYYLASRRLRQDLATKSTAK